MTSRITSYSPLPPPEPQTARTGAKPAAQAASQAAQEGRAAASQADAVTLSAAAQASTQLVAAAQAAPGTDQTAIDSLRAALQAGSYNVAPDELAQAIATVLKESA